MMDCEERNSSTLKTKNNKKVLQLNESRKENRAAKQTSGIVKQTEGNEQLGLHDELFATTKSNIWTFNMKISQEKQMLLMTTEEQKKQIEESLKQQQSWKKNVSEAESQKETLKHDLQTSLRTRQQLDIQLFELQKICTELQEHFIPMSNTLKNCVQTKENILKYHEDIQEQCRNFEKFYSEMSAKCAMRLQQLRQMMQSEREKREQNKLTVETLKMEMEKKIEEVKNKRIEVQEKNTVLINRIKEKTARKDSILSEMKQELQKVNHMVDEEQTRHETLTETLEKVRNNAIQLETSLQSKKTETEFWKNKLLLLQQEIEERRLKNRVTAEELKMMKTKSVALEIENKELDCVLDINNNLREELIQQLEEEKNELHEKHLLLHELEDSIDKKQEIITSAEDELQAKRVEQESLESEYKTKILKIQAEIKGKKKELSDIDLEIQNKEQASQELSGKLHKNKNSISSLKEEIESLKENVTSNEQKIKDLQSLAKDETERREKAEETLMETEASLQEIQASLAEVNKTHESFLLQATRDKSEAEQELKNAERELQNSSINCDWIIQQTKTCVEQCKQNYAQHVEEKEGALTACRNEVHNLTKEVETDTAEKDKLSLAMEDKLKSLEKIIAELDEKLVRKKADNQPQATSTPIDCTPPESVQNPSAENFVYPRSILKSPTDQVMDKQISKQVQFFGVSSDSDNSLLDAPTLFNKNMKLMPVTESSSSKQMESETSLQNKKKQLSKPACGKKFFKSRTQSCLKSRSQLAQDKYFEFDN